ncbi:hypothetical protein CVS48_09700 [Achromobacter spanius]|uniref:hypothetical protein n=1 Tax=Achromobacter spanius TaxID=217203 RepID=UPI000C2C49D0|nr:hypothetical protein [Achromobacter spanius]AUA56287.1 hypothetical protein CVS48_09700 [Achromobacter spanius]CAB3689350.1 hypothetical protein LMG5911_04398 [Achromobacter spanius]SPT39243.1 Uncharacterised protein [Achromobacter denitrificans]
MRSSLCVAFRKRALRAGCAALALLAPWAVSAACTLEMSTSNIMQEIIKENGGVPISDAQCARLNKNSLRLHMNGQATVLNGVSVAWAYVTVSDVNTRVISPEAASQTIVNTKASMVTAKELAFTALESSIAQLDINKAANALRSYSQAAKKK